MEGYYTLLMDRLNRNRKFLFKKLINKEIEQDEFDEKCFQIDLKIELEYINFIANEKLIISSEEIEINMGFKITCDN